VGVSARTGGDQASMLATMVQPITSASAAPTRIPTSLRMSSRSRSLILIRVPILLLPSVPAPG
jgi:hypothetical protein